MGKKKDPLENISQLQYNGTDTFESIFLFIKELTDPF